MLSEHEKPADGSVWAELRARRAQAASSQLEGSGGGAAALRERAAPPFTGQGRARTLDPGAIGRLVEDEVAAMLEMAEGIAGWAGARALDVLRDAESRVNEVRQGMRALAEELHDIVETVAIAVPSPQASGIYEADAEAGPPDVVKIPAWAEIPELAPAQSP